MASFPRFHQGGQLLLQAHGGERERSPSSENGSTPVPPPTSPERVVAESASAPVSPKQIHSPEDSDAIKIVVDHADDEQQRSRGVSAPPAQIKLENRTLSTPDLLRPSGREEKKDAASLLRKSRSKSSLRDSGRNINNPDHEFLHKLPLNSARDMIESGALNTFRPPKQDFGVRADDESKERSATWLELFYDIFYVAVLRILSYGDFYTPAKVAEFIALFITIWWSWLMVTMYDTKYDTDDIVHRAGKLIQMFGIAGYALSISHAFETVSASDVFVISFIVIRAVLLFNYTLVIHYSNKPIAGASETFYAPSKFSASTLASMTAEKRPRVPSALTNIRLWKTTWPLLIANMLSILLFGMSMIIKTTLWTRSMIWLVSILIDVAAHVYVTYGRKQVPFRGSHLPERMGLITIVVIGECVIGILNQTEFFMAAITAGANITPVGKIIGVTLMMITIFFCFWWMYFDDMSSASTQLNRTYQRLALYDRFRYLWIYVHLPLHLMFALLGVFMVAAVKLIFLDIKTTIEPTTVVNATMSGMVTSLSNMTNPSSVAMPLILTTTASEKKSSVEPSALATYILIVFGLLYLLHALIKFIHTSQNFCTIFDRISIISRALFAVISFSAIAVPEKYYRESPILAFFFLTLVLMLLQVLQLGIDIFVQMKNNRYLFRTLSRTISTTIAPGNHGAPRRAHATSSVSGLKWFNGIRKRDNGAHSRKTLISGPLDPHPMHQV